MINSGRVLVTFLIAVNFYRMGRVYLGLQVESISPSLQEKPGGAGGMRQPAESRERRNAVCIWFSSFVLIIQFVT